MINTITGLKLDRGFGFITTDDGAEFFFHAREVHGVPFHWLTLGARVTFEPAGDRRRAHCVQEAA